MPIWRSRYTCSTNPSAKPAGSNQISQHRRAALNCPQLSSEGGTTNDQPSPTKSIGSIFQARGLVWSHSSSSSSSNRAASPQRSNTTSQSHSFSFRHSLPRECYLIKQPLYYPTERQFLPRSPSPSGPNRNHDARRADHLSRPPRLVGMHTISPNLTGPCCIAGQGGQSHQPYIDRIC